jgi:hypothetical protein
MLDTLEPSSIIEAAEQAASAGDYPSAERLLREAARLQETRLGPSHPDLANTLNNLGVVCEITDKPLEAEQCYRRAYAIAVAALEPDHTFVTTSGKNLRAFCEAHGKPVDLPQSPLLAALKPSTAEGRPPTDPIVDRRPGADSPVERHPAPGSSLDHRPAADPIVAPRAAAEWRHEQPASPRVEAQRPPSQPYVPALASAGAAGPPTTASERPTVPGRPVPPAQSQGTGDGVPSPVGKVFRPFPIAVVAISGLVLAVLVLLAGGPGWTGNGDRSASTTSAPATGDDKAGGAPAIQKPPAAAAAQKARSTPGIAKAPTGAGEKAPPTPGAARIDPASPPNATANGAIGAKRGEKAAAAAGPVLGVAIAQVCRTLVTGEDAGPGGWRCDRPESPVQPGQLFFFTRVKAASDTSVVHRWYRGDELRRSVELQIRASPTDGYRTYSRYMVDASSQGDWRLELRTKQGVLLHEERFVVR